MNSKLNQIRTQVDDTLGQWRKQEITALELLQIVGDLRFNQSIELVLFRNDIYDTRPSTLIHMHEFAEHYSDKVLTIETSLHLAKAIAKMKALPPSRMDIGKLGLEWVEEGNQFETIEDFLGEKLSAFMGLPPKGEEQKDVVLYGFGRIGRLAARRIIETTGKGEQLRLKAIVLRSKLQDRYEEAKKRAALLASDSVHGDFHGTIQVAPNGNELTINGNKVRLIFANNPSEINYEDYGISNAMVIDNTGVWRDHEGLSQHLRPGIDSVMLTAPGKGEVPNIVYGVNHGEFDVEKEKVFSAASCTTNAIVPVLKVIQDQFGVVKGHVETIHSYTNDQNLLDNFHKKPRRGRGAPVNMVLTSTGAASAVAKVIPELAGKLSGNAVRVPTPNVSIAILNLTLANPTSLNGLNETLKNAALHGDLVEQIHYSTSTEYVSSNAIGMTSTSVVDAPSTIVSSDGRTAILYLWYDNEYGYTCQVVRLAKYAAKVRRYVYY